MRGNVGDRTQRTVKIIPEAKYPFKIVKASAKDGKNIRFKLTEENSEKGPFYALLVENKRSEKGHYLDLITLETDSKIQPKLSIRIIGDFRQRAEKIKEQTQ